MCQLFSAVDERSQVLENKEKTLQKQGVLGLQEQARKPRLMGAAQQFKIELLGLTRQSIEDPAMSMRRCANRANRANTHEAPSPILRVQEVPMAHIDIKDLTQSVELDRAAML